MPKLYFPRSVGSRIKLYSAVLVGVPLVFTVVVLVLFVRTAILESSEEDLAEQVSSHKVFIEEWFQERQDSVRFLAELDIVKNVQLDLVFPIFKKFAESHPDISAVVFVGPDGRTVADSSSDIIVDVSDREYFIKARAGEPHVTKVIIGRTSGKAIIIFAHPVTKADGSFGGVVFLPSRLTSINELMNNLHFGKTGETYILNKSGYMLTESRYEDFLRKQGRIKKTSIMEIKTDSQVFRLAQVGLQPDGPYIDYRGTEVLGASQWTKGGDWLIVSEIDYDEALEPIYPFFWTVLGGFVVTLLLLSPVVISLGRSIQLPLARISDMAQKMTAGDFEQSCVGIGLMSPPREVKQLVEAFCTMQEKVETTVQELEKSAVTDQLTGLPNRRFLMSEGARMVDVAMRAGQPCSVFMMDIDHFKRINDTHGHSVGDTVLKQLAAILEDGIRTSDIVARYGGEEFTVVAPGSDLDSSRILAERLRQAVEAFIFNTEEVPLACTISIGIAHYSSDIRYGVDAYDDMLSRADEALYEAKRAGRNTVTVSS